MGRLSKSLARSSEARVGARTQAAINIASAREMGSIESILVLRRESGTDYPHQPE
jgi:hypothetical protein